MDHLGSLDALASATEEELTAIDDIGPISAKCVAAYFQRESSQTLMKKFKAAGVNMAQEIKLPPAEALPFSGKTVVITGTCPDMSREEACQLITENGGKVTGTVSKKTSFLVAGENAGSKLEKAHKLEIPVLSWPEVLERLAQESASPEENS